MSGDTGTTALISSAFGAIAAGLAYLLKSAWDRYWDAQDNLVTLQRDKKIELLERQLREFYWPIYFRLQKDNVVWDRILDRFQNDEGHQNVGHEIENGIILPNHSEIANIIESKFYLAKADEPLSDQLFLYLRHISIYKAMRQAGIHDADPIHFNEPWPTDLFPLVEQKTKSLQSEYDELIKTGQVEGIAEDQGWMDGFKQTLKKGRRTGPSNQSFSEED